METTTPDTPNSPIKEKESQRCAIIFSKGIKCKYKLNPKKNHRLKKMKLLKNLLYFLLINIPPKISPDIIIRLITTDLKKILSELISEALGTEKVGTKISL